MCNLHVASEPYPFVHSLKFLSFLPEKFDEIKRKNNGFAL